jgi:polyhydroxyalkanoate synthesis regulator phasin
LIFAPLCPVPSPLIFNLRHLNIDGGANEGKFEEEALSGHEGKSGLNESREGGLKMLDFLKKGALIGVGLVAMTTEKIEEAVSEIVKRGELSEKEGKELVADLVEKSKRIKKDWGEKIEKITSDTLQKLKIPQRKEIDELKARLERLEKQLEKKE